MDIPQVYEGLSIPENVKKELQERQDIIESQYKVYRSLLPSIMQSLGYIEDIRNPNKIKHKMKVVLLYRILLFSFNICTRRDANARRSSAIFLKNINTVFPEIKKLPHADTLGRIVEKINITKLEKTIIELLRDMMRSKKFKHFLYNKGYVIALDGTQKFKRNRKINDNYLERNVKGLDETKKKQYYVYVLEAVLIFSNGMKLPFMSEFLDYKEYKSEEGKQDCEIKAFKRLAKRFKDEFKRSKITVLLDGLYAKGTVIEICNKYRWGYMIKLKDDCLKTVWRDIIGAKKYEDRNPYLKEEDRRLLDQKYGDRNQKFWWVNNVDYDFLQKGKKFKILMLNVVVCNESWVETDTQGNQKQKESKHAWISSEPIEKKNVHSRCNLLGRFSVRRQLN